MLGWIVNNAEWIFSGIGVVVIGALARFIYSRFDAKSVLPDDTPQKPFIAREKPVIDWI